MGLEKASDNTSSSFAGATSGLLVGSSDTDNGAKKGVSSGTGVMHTLLVVRGCASSWVDAPGAE